MGCNWSCVRGALDAQQVADTVVRPDSPHHVLALTGTFVDGGSSSQVFESTDDGATWVPLGVPIDPTAIVTTIDVAASDPMRIYVSATRGYGATRTASLFASTDRGATWAERPIPQFLGDHAGGEASVFIGAVDPTDPNRVYLRSSSSIDGGESRLYVTTDAGMSFQIAKDFQVEGAGLALVGELLGFALSPDGSKVFVGTKESGLWRAARSDLAFSVVNPNVGVQCLATRQTASGPELWACGNEYKGPPGNPGNFIVGKSTDDGATFEAKLATLTSLKGMAECSGSSGGTFACHTSGNTAALCTCADYQQFCSVTEVVNSCLGCGQTGADAGASSGTGSSGGSGSGGSGGGGSGGAADGGKGTGRGTPSSCGCTAVGGGSAAGLLGLLGGVALAAAGLARRRRP
jgi:MYXO-CTERM domain-containing protein